MRVHHFDLVSGGEETNVWKIVGVVVGVLVILGVVGLIINCAGNSNGTNQPQNPNPNKVLIVD